MKRIISIILSVIIFSLEFLNIYQYTTPLEFNMENNNYSITGLESVNVNAFNAFSHFNTFENVLITLFIIMPIIMIIYNIICLILKKDIKNLDMIMSFIFIFSGLATVLLANKAFMFVNFLPILHIVNYGIFEFRR